MEPDRRDLRDNATIWGMYGKFVGKLNVNVGSALNHVVAPETWLNVDVNPNCKPDICCDMRQLSRYVENADTILASHVLEHIDGYRTLFAVMDQFWRALKVGGRVLIFVPHGLSNIAWEDPFHLIRFSPSTFTYFISGMYNKPGNAGYGASQGVPTHPWEIDALTQVPNPEYAKLADEELDKASMQFNNVISEIHCVMRRTV